MINDLREVYMRKVGPLKKEELIEWQARSGIDSDGIFGNQSMGAVLDQEQALSACKAGHFGFTNKELFSIAVASGVGGLIIGLAF